MILHDTCCPAALLLLPHACPPPGPCSSPATAPAPAPAPAALASCSALCLPPHSCSPRSRLSTPPRPAPAPALAPAPAPLRGSAPCRSMHTPALPPAPTPAPAPAHTAARSCSPRSFVPTASNLHPPALCSFGASLLPGPLLDTGMHTYLADSTCSDEHCNYGQMQCTSTKAGTHLASSLAPAAPSRAHAPAPLPLASVLYAPAPRCATSTAAPALNFRRARLLALPVRWSQLPPARSNLHHTHRLLICRGHGVSVAMYRRTLQNLWRLRALVLAWLVAREAFARDIRYALCLDAH
ncbi:hypothetical protein DFH08DRAFT_1049942 [Mycena albidolilacea]|uniref:Uncharacterized protein n=1 Tax=Mycena albidolilacea TaxID=1033008 RepID=A0AAD7EB73_9AGAR|nr:hypothetical protein DFH08DRAFT_1049942 [Mycena albidolilacea]